jgi:hypothetical protein
MPKVSVLQAAVNRIDSEIAVLMAVKDRLIAEAAVRAVRKARKPSTPKRGAVAADDQVLR